MTSRTTTLLIGAGTALLLGGAPLGFAADGTANQQANKIHDVVIQVSDDDARKWNLALNNAENIQQDLGKENVRIEIVAYGPGLGMLKLESPVGARVAHAVKSGVKMVACENTMTKQHLTQKDMLPELDYVKSGVPEIMRKEESGYSYIRP